jgi:hypothetical protein
MKDAKDIRGVDPKSWGAFDQGVSKVSKTLKVLLPVAGATTFVAGCSPAEIKTPPAETAPLPSTAIPTIEPTATVEPTEAPRYTEILPSTLEECKANNVIRWSHFEEDWKQFTDLVDAKTEINIDLYEPFVERNLKSKIPPHMALVTFNNPNKLPGISCAYVDFQDGNGVYVFGAPYIRPNSPNVPPAVLYFAVDANMLNKHFYDIYPQLKGTDIFEKYYDISKTYEKFVSGNFDELSFSYITNPIGSDESIWGNINSLYQLTNLGEQTGLYYPDPQEFTNEYYDPLHFIFSEGGSLITEDKANEGLQKIGKKIIPSAFIFIK